MSVKAMAWVWKQPDIRGTSKLVLLALADCANDDGGCWPGIKTIAKKCGISHVSVIKNIDKLSKFGLINSERRYNENGRRTSNYYTLILNKYSLCKESLRKDNVGLSKGGLTEPLVNHQLKEGDESPTDPKDVVWQEGVKLGIARTLLGKLCKKHTTDRVAQAIFKTKEQAPADPKSYLIGILNNQCSDPFQGAI